MICLSTSGPPYPVKKTCLCIGDDAFVHTACVTEAMRHRMTFPATSVAANPLRWYRCQTCNAPHKGELGLEVTLAGCVDARAREDMYSEAVLLDQARNIKFGLCGNFFQAFDLVKVRFHKVMESLRKASPIVAMHVSHSVMVTTHLDILKTIKPTDTWGASEVIIGLEQTLEYFIHFKTAEGFQQTVAVQCIQIDALSKVYDMPLNALALDRGVTSMKHARSEFVKELDNMTEAVYNEAVNYLQFSCGRSLRQFAAGYDVGTSLLRSCTKCMAKLKGPFHPLVKSYAVELARTKSDTVRWSLEASGDISSLCTGFR